MDMEVFLQKEGIFPGVHKIGVAISGPRIADKNLTDTRIFLKIVCANCLCKLFLFGWVVFWVGRLPFTGFCLVNLFLTNLVRISGFSSLFS